MKSQISGIHIADIQKLLNSLAQYLLTHSTYSSQFNLCVGITAKKRIILALNMDI